MCCGVWAEQGLRLLLHENLHNLCPGNPGSVSVSVIALCVHVICSHQWLTCDLFTPVAHMWCENFSIHHLTKNLCCFLIADKLNDVCVLFFGGGGVVVDGVENWRYWTESYWGFRSSGGVGLCLWTNISELTKRVFLSLIYSISVVFCFVQTLPYMLVMSRYLSYCFLEFFFFIFCVLFLVWRNCRTGNHLTARSESRMAGCCLYNLVWILQSLCRGP